MHNAICFPVLAMMTTAVIRRSRGNSRADNLHLEAAGVPFALALQMLYGYERVLFMYSCNSAQQVGAGLPLVTVPYV